MQSIPSAHSVGAATGVAFQVALENEQRRRNTILAIVSAVAVLIAIFLGLRASGVLQFGRSQANDGLQARGQSPAPDLSVRASSNTPDLGVKAEAPKGMPKDVEDWLRHLQKCERMKQELTDKQSGDLKDIAVQAGIGGLTEDLVKQITDPDAPMPENPMWDKIREAVSKMGPEWKELKGYFDSVPPPLECQPIANSYDEGLAELPATMNELVMTIENVGKPGHLDDEQRSQAREEANRIRRSHKSTIDQSFSRTDQGVADVCRKYGVIKWFSIDAGGGGGGGGVTGLFGF